MDERKRAAMDAMLEHSAKGKKWKNHKYTDVIIVNGKKRYIYPGDGYKKDLKEAYQAKARSDAESSGYEAMNRTRANQQKDKMMKQYYQERERASNAYIRKETSGHKTDSLSNIIDKSYEVADKMPSVKRRNNEYHKARNNSRYVTGKYQERRYNAKNKLNSVMNSPAAKLEKYINKAKKIINKYVKKKFTKNKNQIILPDSGARVTFSDVKLKPINK